MTRAEQVAFVKQTLAKTMRRSHGDVRMDEWCAYCGQLADVNLVIHHTPACAYHLSLQMLDELVRDEQVTT